MATKGFNFRASSGYVTDLGNDTYVLLATDGSSGDDYPTTRNGVTFGWTNRANSLSHCGRDRDSGLNAKLAGLHFTNGAGVDTRIFRIDMSGSLKIRLAIGEPNFPYTGGDVAVKDSAGTKFTATGSPGAGEWYDATSTLRASAATWVSSNAQSSAYTFADYVLIVCESDASGITPLAHVEVEEQAAAVSMPVIMNRLRMNRSNI